jgi:SAM-dependent methyltransferase
MNNPNAIIIDLGAGRKRYKQCIALDLKAYPGIDLCARVQELPFQDGSVDLLIATALLEHVDNIEVVFREIDRVLKLKGSVCITVPFIYPYHPAPLDLMRWTADGLKDKFKDYECLEWGGVGGPNAALCLILSSYFAWLFSFGSNHLYRILEIVLKQIFSPLYMFDNLCGRWHKPTSLDSVVYFIGRKNK